MECSSWACPTPSPSSTPRAPGARPTAPPTSPAPPTTGRSATRNRGSPSRSASASPRSRRSSRLEREARMARGVRESYRAHLPRRRVGALPRALEARWLVDGVEGAAAPRAAPGRLQREALYVPVVDAPHLAVRGGGRGAGLHGQRI